MQKRYVARVSVPGEPGRGPSRTDGPPVARGTATAPGVASAPHIGVAAVAAAPVPPGEAAPPQPPATAPPGTMPVRPDVQPVPPAGVAAPARGVVAMPATPERTGVDGATQMLQASDVTAAIFVDRSGRRARLLRRVVSVVVLLALLLLGALWVSQGAEVLGPRMAA
ncbi:hypothetical protein [Micromonospora sp. RTP1Z1]|uniref:hypothetical protein n=1 Tax=Micromonospora sp. RTP1Z1 TaxID=2994043 RepID=UPI0029C95D0A|nr:hypothetical protein [Micromonospora sp. RTP1Z1]